MKSLLILIKSPVEVGDIYLAPFTKTPHKITKIVSFDPVTKKTVVECTKLPPGQTTFVIGLFNIEYLVKKKPFKLFGS